MTQVVSAERGAALRNKCLKLAKTCRSGSGPASERGVAVLTVDVCLWDLDLIIRLA